MSSVVSSHNADANGVVDDSSYPALGAESNLSVTGMMSPTPTSLTLDVDEDAEVVADEVREVDAISVASTESFPNYLGQRTLTIRDTDTKTVYEAWEIVKSESSMSSHSWVRFWGMRFGVKWVSLDDGFMTLNAITSFKQGELANLHTAAIQEYEAKHSKKGKPYARDLANRAFRLPADVYNKLQHLMEDKIRTTNRTPFRQREWRVVVLEKGEFQMTELLPERKRKGILRRKRSPAMRKWFVVLRGEEIKSTKEKGWETFTRHSNPWWRIDTRETREARQQNRERLEKLHKRHDQQVARNANNARVPVAPARDSRIRIA